MSNTDRNKQMINSRNQWLSTKDGKITEKKKDINHAYAEGFAAGKASNDINTAEFENKSLIELLLLVSQKDKIECLDLVNSKLDTNYDINALNNWISDRKPTPQRAKSLIREAVMQYVFSESIAEKLRALY